MDRLPARIHRGHARGRQYDGAVTRLGEEFAQHCGLAGTGPAGQEKVSLRPCAAGDPAGRRGIDVVGSIFRGANHDPDLAVFAGEGEARSTPLVRFFQKGRHDRLFDHRANLPGQEGFGNKEGRF